MTQTGSRYAWVVVAFAAVLVLADSLISSQLVGLSYSHFSWTALAGAYNTVSLGDAVDAPQLVWTTEGDAPWIGLTGIGYDGIDAAQSGSIGNDQSSWLETTVQGPCTITYWRKVSSEAGWDLLRFYVDGVEQPGSVSGETDWQQQMAVVGDGDHLIWWGYTKDGSVSRGVDAAWVDQVQVAYGSDTDGNGIADVWEWQYFGRLGAVTTNSDWDQDGSSDISEYYAGTDPTNSRSYLGLNPGVLLSSTGFVVRWPSLTGIVYRLDHSTNMSLGFSLLLDNILATPPENVYTDNATGVPAKFYRVGLNDEMVSIPAGSFQMGNCMDPAEGLNSELPVHTVYVSAFHIDRTDVTKAKWDEVCAWAVTHGYGFDHAGSGKDPTHPVQTVSWYDCVKWCNARSEKEGFVPAYYTSAATAGVYRTGQVDVQNDWVNWTAGGYRLPTEAEWEKAARGGASGQRFPWGDTIDHTRANYFAYPESSGGYPYDTGYYGFDTRYNDGVWPLTSPVDSFPANVYGLFDVTGNLEQWCWDWYQDGWYEDVSATRSDTRGPTNSEDGFRLLRGGGWSDAAFSLRSSNRSGFSPNQPYDNIGFRCVR